MKLIAIGASTGGTEAVKRVLGEITQDAPPILIVVHMPAGFTTSFAQKLDDSTNLVVHEAEQGMLCEAGHAYVAPGDFHLRVREQGMNYYCALDSSEKISGHRPAVDVLFRSVVQLDARNTTGVLLTGMGKDGAEGLLELKKAGAYTYVQDEESSAVYGMPKEAVSIDAHCEQLHLMQIANKLSRIRAARF